MIDTNQLMTGDILTGFTPDTPFRVTSILGAYQVGGYALVDNTPRAYMELSVDDLLPMPVTPALLSINGWRVASGGMMVIDLNDNGNKTRFGWKEPGEMIVGYGRVPVYVQHLHHLQNIIRNAGFKDYANNIHLHSI